MNDKLIEYAILAAVCICGLLMAHGFLHIWNEEQDKEAACAQSVCPEPMKPVMVYRQGCVCVTLPALPTQGEQP